MVSAPQEDHATAAVAPSSRDSSVVGARDPVAAAGGVHMSEERRRDDAQQAPSAQADLFPTTTAPSSSSAPANISGAGVDVADDAFLTDALLFSLEEDAELLMLEGVSDEPIDLSDLDLSGIGGFHDDGAVLQGKHEGECRTDACGAGEIGHLPSSAQANAPKPTPNEPRLPSHVRKPRAIKPAGPVTARPACSAGTTHTGETRTTGRKRAKDELEYLRQHVNDLEEQLQQLYPNSHRAEKQEQPPSQMQQFTYSDKNSSASAMLSIVSSGSSSGSSGSGLWKRVASHQMDERRKAEAENARLRDLLEAQLRLARSLARTLRKHPNLTVRRLYLKPESRL